MFAEEAGGGYLELTEVGEGEEDGEERCDFGAALGIFPKDCVEVFNGDLDEC